MNVLKNNYQKKGYILSYINYSSIILKCKRKRYQDIQIVQQHGAILEELKDESVCLWEVAGGQGWLFIYIYIFLTLHDV